MFAEKEAYVAWVKFFHSNILSQFILKWRISEFAEFQVIPVQNFGLVKLNTSKNLSLAETNTSRSTVRFVYR